MFPNLPHVPTNPMPEPRVMVALASPETLEPCQTREMRFGPPGTLLVLATVVAVNLLLWKCCSCSMRSANRPWPRPKQK